MGYDLQSRIKSENDYYRFNIAGWSDVLALAKEYGWKPMGTVMEEPATEINWDGYYHSNDGQMVLDEDAQNIREALEKALVDDSFLNNEHKVWIGRVKGFVEFLKNGDFYIY
jgi:hypothetical protein